MADADAMGEAVTRPPRRFVPSQELTQQDLQALHRVRERLVNARTALLKAIRGWLSADGMVWPQGITTLRQGLLTMREQEQAQRTALRREVFRPRHEEWRALEPRLDADNCRRPFAPERPLAVQVVSALLYASRHRGDREDRCTATGQGRRVSVPISDGPI